MTESSYPYNRAQTSCADNPAESGGNGDAVHLKELAQHVREKGDKWADDLRVTVRRKPLSAVAAAMAIGALIACIKR